jgi:hypothetical protein
MGSFIGTLWITSKYILTKRSLSNGLPGRRFSGEVVEMGVGKTLVTTLKSHGFPL